MSIRATALASLVLAALAIPQLSSAADKMATDKWPESAKKAVKEMTDKYGEPSGSMPTQLVWTNKGPYKEIILLNEEYEHDFPVMHKDCLEHVVAYKVPVDKIGDLAKFDGSVIVDRTRGTLGARCDTEAHNLIALNLANDIITGKKSVDEARQAYADIVKEEKDGKKPAYTQTLQFKPVALMSAGDKDMPLQAKAGAADSKEAIPAADKSAPIQD